MEIRTTYSVDREDAPALGQNRILELENLIAPYILPEEIEPGSRRDRHPGVNGLRSVKQNAFTAEELSDLADYTDEILERMKGKVAEMEAELPTLTFDNEINREMGLKAANGILDGVRASISRTEEIVTEFVTEFRLAAGFDEEKKAAPGM